MGKKIRKENKLKRGHSEECPQFRTLLLQEFSKRKNKNPRYSLRAFARHLDIESSQLSKILRGKRPLNRSLARQIGVHLNIVNLDWLLQKDLTLIDPYRRSTPSYKSLSIDKFKTIEDWRHYAILELMKVEQFQPTTSWLGQALGISEKQAGEYVARLSRSGLLEIKPNGEWQDLSEGYSTHVLTKDRLSEVHVRTQLELLKLSERALRSLPMTQRDHSSIMMATHRSKLAGAKKKIQKFRRELCSYLENSSSKNTVFQLTVGLFPVLEEQ